MHSTVILGSMYACRTNWTFLTDTNQNSVKCLMPGLAEGVDQMNLAYLIVSESKDMSNGTEKPT